MRVLFTSHDQSGHFHPLVPLARALQHAGHAVAFATSESFCPTVAASGFPAFPAGFDGRGALTSRLFPQARSLDGERYAAFVETRMFAFFHAQLLVPDLVRIGRSWSPDVIVREGFEFGGCIAAERLGIPHAVVEVGAYRGPAFHPEAMARSLDRVRRAFDLPPDPGLAMLARYLHLSFVPPSFQDPATPLPPTAHVLRHVPFDRPAGEGLPDWVAHLVGRPTVYATLGTRWNGTPDLFAAIIAALRDEPVNLIVTVGRDGDPAAFGAQPANVHIERYIPQSLLFPHCDLVLTHGGWNTTLAALSCGLPLVLIPISADQPDNARRCARLRAGRVVGAGERTPEAIRTATRAILADPMYRANAARVRDETAALPGLEYAVALLERLAAEKQPLLPRKPVKQLP